MKEKWSHLIFLLSKSADLYAELLELSKTKRDVLVSGKAIDLVPITKQEEVLLLQLGKFETARAQLVEEFAVFYNRKPQELTLNEIESAAGNVSELVQADVKMAGERLKLVVNELAEFNKLNVQLTKQALFFVNCSINLLMQNKADVTYSPANNTNQSEASSRLFIDRKV